MSRSLAARDLLLATCCSRLAARDLLLDSGRVAFVSVLDSERASWMLTLLKCFPVLAERLPLTSKFVSFVLSVCLYY